MKNKMRGSIKEQISEKGGGGPWSTLLKLKLFRKTQINLFI